MGAFSLAIPTRVRHLPTTMLPVGSLSTVALNLLQDCPCPMPAGKRLNYLGAATNTNDDQYLAKIDYTRGSHHLSGHYFFTQFTRAGHPGKEQQYPDHPIQCQSSARANRFFE